MNAVVAEGAKERLCEICTVCVPLMNDEAVHEWGTQLRGKFL